MSSRSVGSVTIGDGLGVYVHFALSVMVRVGTITQRGAGSSGRDAASALACGPGLVRTSHFLGYFGRRRRDAGRVLIHGLLEWPFWRASRWVSQ